MSDSTSFGEWIRRRRRALDLTRAALAQQVGCAVVTIRKIETDERRPSRQVAERLAECLQVPAEQRAAFLQAARAELAVDRLPTPPASPLDSPPSLSPSPVRPLADLQPVAQAFKGYKLHEQIGAGGFGTVYRATQPGVGRDVAVKIVRPEYANQPEFIRRFEAEAQLVARLEHPYIVPLYDYWRERAGAYLVMRYIRGGSLQAALRSGPWPLERCTQLLEQIAAALAFAHRHGVVHRDLKPANILLDEEGHAYLADFGIAKDVRVANATSQTQAGAIIGSPEYLSPEQIKDDPVTPRTDIYSLGMLLYETLSGVHPFAGLPPAERMYNQLYRLFPPLHDLRPELPAALNAVIQRATAKQPADRYPDLVRMVADWQQASAPEHALRPTWDQAPTAPAVTPVVGDDRAVPQAPSVAAMDSITITDLATIENPYKGLRAFTEADTADFFGRDALIQQLLERLAEESGVLGPLSVAEDNQQQATNHEPLTPSETKGRITNQSRFLAVVGPSGSGKSSVVRAGLLPALRQGGLPDSERWFVIEMLPGAYPLEELEAALLRIAVNPPESLLGQLREDERGLARAVKRALPADTETELVLVIDQFEELWTLTQNESVRAHFLASLHAAVTDPRSRVRVIITLRADFTDRPLMHADIGGLLQERTAFVLPLTPAELEQAIAGPAARVGVTPVPELITTIVKDVGEQPGTLPLLQYALTELFESRTGSLMGVDAYRANGGVLGALARRADELYAGLTMVQQEATRQLFLRLVTPGEGVEDTRRRVRRAELDAMLANSLPTVQDNSEEQPSKATPPSIDTVIERCGRARLLTFDRDPITREPTVEVAHEALIRTWGRLRAWLDTSRADVRMQRILANIAAEWYTAGLEPSYLMSGARLTQFEAWAAQTDVALTEGERAFLKASLAEQSARETTELEQARALVVERTTAAAQLRRRATMLAGALVLALVAAAAAGGFARTAQNNYARSEHLRLVSEANSAIDHGASGDLPTLLALRSLRYDHTPQAIEALRRALQVPFPIRRFVGHADAVEKVAFSPNGTRLLTGSADGTARLWDVATGDQLLEFKGHTGPIRDVAFSPDGDYVLTASIDKTARLWDAATGAEVRRFTSQIDEVWAVAFSPDGKQLFTGGRDYLVRQWDVTTGKQVRFFPVLDTVRALALSSDGRYIAITSAQVVSTGGGGSIQVWDLTSPWNQVVYFFGQSDGVNDVAFTPDGAQLITAGIDGTVRIWDARAGKERRRIEGHDDAVMSLALTSDGKYLLTGSRDQTARLWEFATGRQLRVYGGHAGAALGVAFSPDGQQILTGSTDGTARLWETPSSIEPAILSGHTDEIHAVAVSPDGSRLLTGSADTTARLWDAATGRQLYELPGHEYTIIGAAFSPDGRYALSADGTQADGNGSLRLWDVRTGTLVRSISSSGVQGQAFFTPDGRFIISGSTIGEGADPSGVRMWDVATGHEERRMTHSLGMAIALSSDGMFLAVVPNRSNNASHADQTVELYAVATGELLQTFSGHADAIAGVAISPDRRYVLAGAGPADPTARLWDAKTGAQIRVFSGHSNGIQSVAFSPDGKQVLTGSLDGTARLWDRQTGQELRVLRGHTGPVYAVAFAPDGKAVLTGGADKTARLWHLDDQDLVRIACAALSRDLTPEERATYSVADDTPTCAES